MRKLIFVLSYNEGPDWIAHYSNDFMTEFKKNNFLFIILDNGIQNDLKDWCAEHDQIYFRTENNLGSTGGYNFFIRAGEILKSKRIGVIQADVFVNYADLFDFLFYKPFNNKLIPSSCLEYTDEEFVYFPNLNKNNWRKDGIDPDVGQFFSLCPWFFILHDYLCDENYTVTHFESVDLFIRMTSEENIKPVKVVNILDRYFSNYDNSDLNLYFITHKTSYAGMHDKWFEYNSLYWKAKWDPNDTTSTVEDLFQAFKEHRMNWSRFPWTTNYDSYFKQLVLHRKPLQTHRNINVGQVPYPVEYECNRFFKEFIKTNILEPGTYY